MVLVLLAGLAATAFAADASITFKGQKDGFEFQPGSDYTATDLFGSFKGVMPGDVLTEEITFKNAATDCDFVNLYMRAVPHGDENPLSEKVAEKRDPHNDDGVPQAAFHEGLERRNADL